MHSVSDPAQSSLEQQKQQKELKTQQQTQKAPQYRVVSHPWQQQQQQQQSSCPSESTIAFEVLSPCCCACFYRGTAAAEIPHEREAPSQTGEMYFYACGKSRQHPLKAAPFQTTNADAFLIDSQIVGVADGVGSVQTEGFDPALLPVELLTQCSILFRLRQQNTALFDAESETLWTSSSGHVDGFDIDCFPLHILARAHASCISLGSTTCVLGMLDTKSRRLYTVNVGDSQLLLLRRVSDRDPVFKQRKEVYADKEEITATPQQRLAGRDSLPAKPTFLLPPRSNALTSVDGGTAGGAEGEAASAAREEQRMSAEEEQAAELAAAAAAAADKRGRVAHEPVSAARTAPCNGVAQAAAAASAAADGTVLVKIATPPLSGAVASALTRAAEVLLPYQSAAAEERDAAASADEANHCERRQAQQSPKPSSNGDWGRAAEKERRLQATGGVYDSQSRIDESHATEEQEDSLLAIHKGRQPGEKEIEGGDGYRIIYRTEVQQHFFNCPYQLTRMPDVDCSQEALLQRTQACADLGFCHVQGGDIVILGSDGLFDNLFETDIVAVVNAFCSKGNNDNNEINGRGSKAPAAPPVDPALVADKLLNMALAAAAGGRADAKTAPAAAKREDESSPHSFCSRSPSTPFSQAAYEELGRHIEGGKPDDTTVVVAYVVDPLQQQVQTWPKPKRAQLAEKKCACVESSVAFEAAERDEKTQFSETSAQRRTRTGAAAESKRKTVTPVVVRDTAQPASASGSGSGFAAVRITGKASATVASTEDATAAAHTTTGRGAAEGAAAASASAEFAKRRTTTLSREELGSSVSEEAGQMLSVKPCRTSVVAHGRCQTSSSPDSAPQPSDRDCEIPAPDFRCTESARAAALPLGCLQNSSSTCSNPQNTKKPRHRVFLKGKGENVAFGAERWKGPTVDPSCTVKQTDGDSSRSYLLQKETRQTAGTDSELPRPRRACTSAATDAAEPSTKGHKQICKRHPLADGIEGGVAARVSTTAGDTTTVVSAERAKTAATVPPTRGWCLFPQPQANPHNLTLVIRAAPTAGSKCKVVHTPNSRKKAQSPRMFTDAGGSRLSPRICMHAETSTDRGHPRTDGESDTTSKSSFNVQHQQTRAPAAAAEIGAIAAARHSATSAAAPAASGAAAVKGDCASSGEGGVAAALLASAACRFRRYATAWTSLSQLRESEGTTVAVQSMASALETTGEAARFPAGTCNAAVVAAEPVATPSTGADTAAAVRPLFDRAAPTTAGATPLGGLQRRLPVSMSTVLACSRRSFPPVNAAGLMGLRVYPPATRLQHMYAADKEQALTPVAVAAALGAGTSPACVAAVHMKIRDQRGG